MATQEKTERVLRDIHVLFSKAQPFENSKRKVVVDKMRMMTLLKELNECMYDMMEEYEMTSASREKAELRIQRKNDQLIFDARKEAEDIYAASLMYSDRSLSEIGELMKQSLERYDNVHADIQRRLKKEIETIKENQYELKGQLQDLIDTQKYLMLIEAENEKIAKKKKDEKEDEAQDEPDFAAAPLDIKINEDYFREQGLLDEPAMEEAAEEEKKPEEPEIKVNLDAEYFQWKDGEKGEDKEADEVKEKPKRKGLFGL